MTHDDWVSVLSAGVMTSIAPLTAFIWGIKVGRPRRKALWIAAGPAWILGFGIAFGIDRMAYASFDEKADPFGFTLLVAMAFGFIFGNLSAALTTLVLYRLNAPIHGADDVTEGGATVESAPNSREVPVGVYIWAISAVLLGYATPLVYLLCLPARCLSLMSIEFIYGDVFLSPMIEMFLVYPVLNFTLHFQYARYFDKNLQCKQAFRNVMLFHVVCSVLALGIAKALHWHSWSVWG